MCRGTQCHDASDASPRQQPAIPRTGFDVLLCAPESRLLVMGIAHWSSAPYLCAMPAPTTASPCLFFEETPPAKLRLRSRTWYSWHGRAPGSPVGRWQQKAKNLLQCNGGNQARVRKAPPVCVLQHSNTGVDCITFHGTGGHGRRKADQERSTVCIQLE